MFIPTVVRSLLTPVLSHQSILSIQNRSTEVRVFYEMDISDTQY